jgi:hypothetical protein
MLLNPPHDCAQNLGASQRWAADGSRKRLRAWITRAVFNRLDQTKTLQVVAVSGDVRGSRLPTRAEPGKPNPMFQYLFNFVQSKAACPT